MTWGYNLAHFDENLSNFHYIEGREFKIKLLLKERIFIDFEFLALIEEIWVEENLLIWETSWSYSLLLSSILV